MQRENGAMHILVVGGGGREHALAWKLAQSPRVTRLSIAPGNAGTARLGQNVEIDATDIVSLLDYATTARVDLTVVGPEEPLEGGLVDQFEAAGLRVFGPTRPAARVETSKSYAKELMVRHGVPTAPYETFTDFDAALDYVLDQPLDEIVIKADGLARGKGVFLPRGASDAEGILRALLERDALGEAGRQVLIERRLVGPEVSLAVFTDGVAVALMPPLTDYKRLLAGDLGPNTGGMGSYAPTPLLPVARVDEVRRHIVEPVLEGLRQDACCFRGVLTVGIVLTDEGPLALELNARFGDPGAQTVLPLLATDLLDVAEACVEGRLGELPLAWHDADAVSVVVVSEGYPGRVELDLPVRLPEDLPPDVLLFQAATRRESDGSLRTSGGRVVSATAIGPDFPTALDRVYEAAGGVMFEGAAYRPDIGEWLRRA